MESKNHNRKMILDNDYMKYMDNLKVSPRNKEIVKRYVNGENYKELAKEYDVTPNRIAQIISQYINSAYRYRKDK